MVILGEFEVRHDGMVGAIAEVMMPSGLTSAGEIVLQQEAEKGHQRRSQSLSLLTTSMYAPGASLPAVLLEAFLSLLLIFVLSVESLKTVFSIS